jgi:ABC-type transport system involved in cytochrome c biogenesis ATPase subunit/predicted GNAT family acetyltransferase
MRKKSRPHRIRSILPKAHQKQIAFERPAESRLPFLVHRFAMVGQADALIVHEGIERKVWVVGEAADIPLVPIFERYNSHDFAGGRVETRVAEISTAPELQDQEALEAFHYRGLDFSDVGQGAVSKKKTGGRRAILILQLKLSGCWLTAGYIELQMPLMMAKPRHLAFDRPFSHPKLKVSWKSWRKGGQALVNRIARIARVVVHPELRGTGLARLLVKAAVNFARDRWHIAGRQALFVEISAEMLRHIDFVSSCGFHYLVDTEGNRARLSKDMMSMKQGPRGGSGIMSLQRRYYALFESYRKATGETFESLQSRLADVLSSENPWERMTLDEWLALRPVIRSPIPYFMIGLDAYCDDYVQSAAQKKPTAVPNKPRSLLGRELQVSNVNVWSNYEVSHTDYSRLVMDAFGITTRRLKTCLVGPISFEAQAGTITFVAGSSGCGKSLLLAALDPIWKSHTTIVNGKVMPRSYSVGWLKPLPESAPLFEYLATMHGAERTFDALSRVGLSEAMLFLKPFGMLSRGQRYRAMLAQLVLGDDDVWLIDEFCSDLDPLAARIVAYRLRQTVRRERRIAIVAAANHGHFINALHPARVVKLETGGGVVIPGGAYVRGFSYEAR